MNRDPRHERTGLLSRVTTTAMFLGCAAVFAGIGLGVAENTDYHNSPIVEANTNLPYWLMEGGAASAVAGGLGERLLDFANRRSRPNPNR